MPEHKRLPVEWDENPELFYLRKKQYNYLKDANKDILMIITFVLYSYQKNAFYLHFLKWFSTI